MNFIETIQSEVKNPAKWVGRRATACKKHGFNHYVDRFCRLGCIGCDQPIDSSVLLRLYEASGVWCDTSDGFREKRALQAKPEPFDYIGWAMGAFPKPPRKPIKLERYTFD